VAAEKSVKSEDLQKAIDKAVTSTLTNHKDIKDAVARQVSEAYASKEVKENVSRSVASAVNAKDVSDAVNKGISDAVDEAIKKSVNKAADPGAVAWKGVGVDVILIGRDFGKQSFNVAAWTEFCRAHRGVVVTLPATNKAPALPDVDRDELKYHLLRLTAPR